MSQPGNHDMVQISRNKVIIKHDDRIDLHIYKEKDNYIAVRIKGNHSGGPEFIFDNLSVLYKWLKEELELRFKGSM